MNDLEPESSSAGLSVAETQPLASERAVELAACWNTKGVYGNGECAELEKLIHCRNCSDYSRAGLLLLDRALPPEYRREWTEHFAQQKQLSVRGKTSVVIFRLGAEWLALAAEVLQEVAEGRRIHSLPHRRQGVVLGLVNVRGELLICVSVGRLLGLEDPVPQGPPRASPARLMVANWNGHRFVFPADDVYGVHRLQAQELQAPPTTVAKATPSYTRALFLWRQRAVGVLDANLLFPALDRSLS